MKKLRICSSMLFAFWVIWDTMAPTVPEGQFNARMFETLTKAIEFVENNPDVKMLLFGIFEV